MGSKHLFVFVHGLWGNHGHMKSLMEAYGKQFGNEDMVFFSPSESALFRTFDGIELVGYRTLLEIYLFIKNFKAGPITKISVLGYSMGGLVARFVLGKMFGECSDLFEGIEPQIFITMATPHLGVHYYNPRRSVLRGALQFGMRLIGTSIIGKSGRELFVVNKANDILVRLSSGEYLEALSRFKWRVAFANVSNDRSVAFYTGFITNCDPFINTENQMAFAFEEKVPGKAYTFGPPRIVDMDRLDEHKSRLMTQVQRWKKIGRLLLFVTVFGILIMPLGVCLNLGGTIYSHLVSYRSRQILQDCAAPGLLRKRLEFNDSIKVFTEDVYRTMMGAGTESTSASSDSLDNSEQVEDGMSWREFIANHIIKWKNRQNFEPLPFDENRITMLKNLGSLEWIRVAVYIKMHNSHGAMVARRGLKPSKSGSTGIACVEFSAQLLQYLLDHCD